MAAKAKALRTTALHIGGREVTCRLVPSKAATRLRIKVRTEGVEVVLPVGRDVDDGIAFVLKHETWVAEQLDRAQRMVSLRRAEEHRRGQVLFRGDLVHVDVRRSDQWRAPARVALEQGRITVTCSNGSRTPVQRSLENWMRKQARSAIEQHLEKLTKRLRRAPGAVYVMGQRTKWGNCSALGNLSFNWRLIMAPDYVLRYIVTHETVHLVVPDHSPKFWLTVQSLCPEMERARQWLVSNGRHLKVDFREMLSNGTSG